MNRWVLDPAVRNGLPTMFRPLKKITVTPPAREYIVGERFNFDVTIDSYAPVTVN